MSVFNPRSMSSFFNEPTKFDVDRRTRGGRIYRDFMNAASRKFGDSDLPKLRELVLLQVELDRLARSVVDGNAQAIAVAARLSNAIERRERELRAAAKHTKESASC